MDLNWLSQEAKHVHESIEVFFYALVTFCLIVGVILEYFKLPLGKMPSFGTLVSRTVIAVILLQTYAPISNAIAEISDALSSQVGHLNQFDLIRDRLGKKFSAMTLSWLSVKESITIIVCYLVFVLFHLSYYMAEAFLLYAWTLLYVFSPVLIACFVIPQTAPATSALYRSLIEVSLWKPVWSVIATLLWSLPLSEINKNAGDANFLSVISIVVLLAASLLMTPYIVHALAGAGLTSMSPNLGRIGMGTLSLGPKEIVHRTALVGNHAKGLGMRMYNSGHYAATTLSEKHFPKASFVIKKLPKFKLQSKTDSNEHKRRT